MDRVIMGILFAAIELSIAYALATIWLSYTSRSGWSILAWLLLPAVAVPLYIAFYRRISFIVAAKAKFDQMF